jgi:amino acid transporter
VFNLLLIAAAGLIATRLSLATATSFINFGAFLAFTVVNVCVIAMYVRFRRTNPQLNVLSHVVLPALGALVDAYLLTKLSRDAIVLGGSWLVLGVAYLLVRTRGLRQAPPELSLDEAPDADDGRTPEAAAYAG